MKIIQAKRMFDAYADIQAKTTTNLLMEAGAKNYRKVKVVFKAPYDPVKHASIKNEAMVASLKQQKTETYDVVSETQDIIKLLNSPDVVSIMWTK